MPISLTPGLAKFVDYLVKSGRYASADDAVNAAVARLQTEHELTPEEIADLRDELDPAIAEADAGTFADFTAEDIIAERRAAHKRQGS
jgi:putative addiction module CopG family antidote